MKRKYKAFIKINLFTLIMIAISFGSVTFAWFGYTGRTNTDAEIDVKAWYIELEHDGSIITNEINVSFDNLVPGMTPQTESITVNNLGDADALLKHSIVSARILDKPEDLYESAGDPSKSEEIEDAIAHNYPFRIDIAVSDKVVESKTGIATYDITVSWPLDSGDNQADTYWGNQAYYYKQQELAKQTADPTYELIPAVELQIDFIAEQSIGSGDELEVDYLPGTEILIDPTRNQLCTNTNVNNCYTTHVYDSNNTYSDTTVTLIASLTEGFALTSFNNLQGFVDNKASTWVIDHEVISAVDYLKLIATNSETYLKRNGLSDIKVGNIEYGTRATTELQEGIDGLGTYVFSNTNFDYLASSTCYWTNTSINDTHAYAIKTVAGETTMYPELKTTNCLAVPIMVINKADYE